MILYNYRLPVHVGLVQVKYTFPHLESVVFSSIEYIGIGSDSV